MKQEEADEAEKLLTRMKTFGPKRPELSRVRV